MLMGFPGAFLLVTHDNKLADAVVQIQWKTKLHEGSYRLEIR